MQTRAVIESFWDAMRANDWLRAASHFTNNAVIDWPCSGERIRNPAAWAEIQERYPAADSWVFDIHRQAAGNGELGRCGRAAGGDRAEDQQ